MSSSSSHSKLVPSDSLNLKCANKKHEAFLRFKYLKELSNVKSQIDLNAELNKKTACILDNIKCVPSNTSTKKENSTLSNSMSRKQQEIFSLSRSVHRKRIDILSVNKNISKINSDLISYVKLRQNYMQHDNYWKQSWIFTDNPVYECGKKNIYNINISINRALKLKFRLFDIHLFLIF